MSQCVTKDEERELPTTAERYLSDYFRCPETLLALFEEPEECTTQAGYFQFGKKIVCYGSLPGGGLCNDPNDALVDVLCRITIGGAKVKLPFRVSEVVDNLRRERYAAYFRREGPLLNRLVRHVYYMMRPLLKVPLRRHLQKLHLRGWDEIRFPEWPVDLTVEYVHQKLLALSLEA